MAKKQVYKPHKVKLCKHCKAPYRWNGALRGPSCDCELRREMESHHGQTNWLRAETLTAERAEEHAAEMAYIDKVAAEVEAKAAAYKEDPDAYFGPW